MLLFRSNVRIESVIFHICYELALVNSVKTHIRHKQRTTSIYTVESYFVTFYHSTL